MAIAAIAIKKCNIHDNSVTTNNDPSTGPVTTATPERKQQESSAEKRHAGLNRNAGDLFFTKHARCRMKCRQITQEEVKAILLNGTINYNKSNLQDPRGATYAVEGFTKDRQHVRIIFAPKQYHLSVVTVIDLDEEHPCSCH